MKHVRQGLLSFFFFFLGGGGGNFCGLPSPVEKVQVVGCFGAFAGSLGDLRASEARLPAGGLQAQASEIRCDAQAVLKMRGSSEPSGPKLRSPEVEEEAHGFCLVFCWDGRISLGLTSACESRPCKCAEHGVFSIGRRCIYQLAVGSLVRVKRPDARKKHSCVALENVLKKPRISPSHAAPECPPNPKPPKTQNCQNVPECPHSCNSQALAASHGLQDDCSYLLIHGSLRPATGVA